MRSIPLWLRLFCLPFTCCSPFVSPWNSLKSPNYRPPSEKCENRWAKIIFFPFFQTFHSIDTFKNYFIIPKLKVFVQVFVLSLILTVFAANYTLLNFVPVPDILVSINMYLWVLLDGKQLLKENFLKKFIGKGQICKIL